MRRPDLVRSAIRLALLLAMSGCGWGIGDDVDLDAAVDRATPAKRAELERAIVPSEARITAWLDSFRQQPMTDEAAAFMYMQLALEEMRAGTR